jgi:transcriptional regulator of arginine metabolism
LATDLNAQILRRDAIVRILRQTAVGRQAELVDLLHRAGFDATQSSVSRDLRELGVVKGADRYLVPASEDALTPSHFEDVRAFVKGYRGAGPTLTVLRTTAGDDTIFIATESARAQQRLHDHLRSTFGR